MAKVILTKPAQIELGEIISAYTALAGVNSARKMVDRIYNTLSRLEDFPLSGHPILDQELFLKGYRFVVASPYLCIYEPVGEQVIVHHIVHGASNYPSLLKNNFTEM